MTPITTPATCPEDRSLCDWPWGSARGVALYVEYDDPDFIVNGDPDFDETWDADFVETWLADFDETCGFEVTLGDLDATVLGGLAVIITNPDGSIDLDKVAVVGGGLTVVVDGGGEVAGNFAVLHT